MLKQVTVSSHLQANPSSFFKRSHLPLYTIRQTCREADHPQSHTPSSPDPPAAVPGQQCSSKVLCSRTLCSYCLSGHLQKTLKYFSHAMFCAAHSLPLARTNSGRNYLFPAQKKSCTFKCSSSFTVSSSNNFKICYSTAVVLYLITTQLYSQLGSSRGKSQPLPAHGLNPHVAKITHPLLTLACPAH